MRQDLRMEMSEVPRATAAATAVAVSLGLPTDGATVLHDSNKLALRLRPCDVFARAAPVGQEAARFEIELAQRLAEVGGPVCPLEPRVDPRVYVRDGFTVTLWTCCEPVAPHVPQVEFDFAHVPEAVCEHYPGLDRGMLEECRQLVLAMVAAWRWGLGDEFPNGRPFGEELLRALREGPPGRHPGR